MRRALFLAAAAVVLAATVRAQSEEGNRSRLFDELDRSLYSIRGRDLAIAGNAEEQLEMARRIFEMRVTEEDTPSGNLLTDQDAAFLRRAERELQERGLDISPALRGDIQQQVVDELLRRVNREKRLWLQLRETTIYNTNVTQTPEATVKVRGTAGTQSVSAAHLKYEARQEPFGKPSVSLEHSISRYVTGGFADWDSKNVGLTLSDRLNLRANGISFLICSVDLRGDWLRGGRGGFDHAFTTIVPRAEVMLSPSKPAEGSRRRRISDLFITYLSLGVEKRDYTDSNLLDVNGIKKNSDTPFLTLILMNLKNWRSHPSRTSLSLALRSQQSASDEFTFDYGRIGLSYAVPFPRWSLTPELAVAVRDQAVYLTRPRRDQSFEPRLSFGWNMYREVLVLAASVGGVLQRSTMESFTYRSLQASLGLTCRL